MGGNLVSATPLFTYGLRTVTEAAARAAYRWIGRGDRLRCDLAAVKAMHAGLSHLAIDGQVIIGEGSQEETALLFRGDRVGQGCLGGAGPETGTGLSDLPSFDVAVDPVEGTSYLVKGMTNAMAVVAMAPRGTIFDPGPAFYMEKFAAPPVARGKIDPLWPVSRKLQELARLLGKRIGDLTVYILEKPRHRALVEAVYAAGARVALYPAGDIAGALMAAIPESGIDCLLGTGGTPEGVIAACGIRCLGGEFFARIDPQLASERSAVEAAGLDCTRWYGVEELVRSEEVFFSATGITTGLLLQGVECTATHEATHTLLLGGTGGDRQFLTTFHRRGAE